MTFIFDGPPDERPIMERLARMVAHLSGDSWKSAHTILQDALTKPETPDGLREALESVLARAEKEYQTLTDGLYGKFETFPEAKKARKALDADSARRNAEANKPAYPGGRW